MIPLPHSALATPVAALFLLLSWPVESSAAPGAGHTGTAKTEAPEPKTPRAVFGVALRGGGRYDDVRMCVATAAGVKGGPAMDVAFRVEIPLRETMSLNINLPVMRPILFGVSFDMLQFEPEVTLAFRVRLGRKVDLIVGPSLGLSFHYGPDYRSAYSVPDRGRSFFALGPRIGGYLGLDFKRPGKVFNFQLGIHPYVTPMFGVDDPESHRGVVVGGTLDALFRFAWHRR